MTDNDVLEESTVEIRNLIARAAISGLGFARKSARRVARAASASAQSPPPRSPKLSSLEIVQVENLLQVKLSSTTDIVPSGLWVENDGDLHRLDSMERPEPEGLDSEVAAEQSMTVDLDALIGQLPAWSAFPQAGSGDSADSSGFALRFYLEFTGYDADEIGRAHV